MVYKSNSGFSLLEFMVVILIFSILIIIGGSSFYKIIKNKQAIYDLKVDQRVSKFNKGQKLMTIDLKLLPNYIQNNIGKFKLWLD